MRVRIPNPPPADQNEPTFRAAGTPYVANFGKGEGQLVQTREVQGLIPQHDGTWPCEEISLGLLRNDEIRG